MNVMISSERYSLFFTALIWFSNVANSIFLGTPFSAMLMSFIRVGFDISGFFSSEIIEVTPVFNTLRSRHFRKS